MAHNSEAGFATSSTATFASAAFAPLRVAGRFIQSIIAANRLSKEIENSLHINQGKLNGMGIARDEVVLHVLRTSANFRAL
ncbi:hypothetical protein RKLH11_3727 [Rhodobacteraceae bacterium KLH11]|nr:hypothetical protein RKLH11_3727 [Rhodobacteraceae bacterium KLH11]